MLPAATRLGKMLDELGRITDEPGRLTRTFLSPAMRRTNHRVGRWLRAAGLKVREDAFGNLIGRLEPRPDGRIRPPTLVLGSHLDTVRDAGRFDGALGVLLPIVALEELRRRGVRLPFAVEVVGFSEEEGVRFASAYLGSKGYTGQLRSADLRRRDAAGVTVERALATFRRTAGRAGKAAGARAHRPAELLGYLEVHIEQGPVLEAKNLAVGIVEGIAGQTRGQFVFRGQAGHAGTTPMALRRDALAGAAEFILMVEREARREPPLVATVGTLALAPGAPNVIPGEVAISLDLRHPRDAARRASLRRLRQAARAVAGRRGLALGWSLTQDNAAALCSPQLTRPLAQSVRAVQGSLVTLVSGAGHDAVVLSSRTPVAMLFVRCRAGLSHHPAEYAAPKDLAVALEVMIDFLTRLRPGQGQ